MVCARAFPGGFELFFRIRVGFAGLQTLVIIKTAQVTNMRQLQKGCQRLCLNRIISPVPGFRSQKPSSFLPNSLQTPVGNDDRRLRPGHR